MIYKNRLVSVCKVLNDFFVLGRSPKVNDVFRKCDITYSYLLGLINTLESKGLVCFHYEGRSKFVSVVDEKFFRVVSVFGVLMVDKGFMK